MSDYQTIEVDEFIWMINKGIIDAMIDIRSQADFVKGHVQFSRNFPARQFKNYFPLICDYLESGVNKIAIICNEEVDNNDMVFQIMSNRFLADIVFVKFDTRDWKDVGGLVIVGEEKQS